MQVGEATVDQRAHEVHRHCRARMRGDHAARIGHARGLGEGRRIDHIAAIARQGHAIARFGIGRARLGVLPGEATHPHHRQMQAVHQHQAHLQQHLQPVGDGARFAIAEILSAIATLQQEALAFLRFRQLALERKDFPRGHQRRQPPQLVHGRLQRVFIRVHRQLQCRFAAPAVRRPRCGGGIGNGSGSGKIHERTPRQPAMLAEPERYAKRREASGSELPPRRSDVAVAQRPST